jgi:hypothetical protein
LPRSGQRSSSHGTHIMVLRVEGSATFYVLGMVGVSGGCGVVALLEHPRGWGS